MKSPDSCFSRLRVPAPQCPDKDAEAKCISKSAEEVGDPPERIEGLFWDKKEDFSQGSYGIAWSVMV